jgi:hypothetical protein
VGHSGQQNVGHMDQGDRKNPPESTEMFSFLLARSLTLSLTPPNHEKNATE